ncbi:MAG: hypothetical protein ABS82_00310 [Rhodanobacter sp. SCN 67-45]|nr:MAG: hypothetical protein ABS82_00310 [Rhodanobacter sp. SCN 67-45]
MNAQHTPGPWFIGDWGHIRSVCGRICTVAPKEGAANVANARLIAAAPDHAMIASALCSGAARWEPFASGSGGEFCIGGLRHATNLDQFGVPVMTDGMRAAIAEATGETP